MSVKSILVVCLGNICRSPVGERLLAARLPGVAVSSAGLGAMVGQPADPETASAAAAADVSVAGHVARQFTGEMARQAELILVMDAEQRRSIAERHPEVSGRVMLFDHWLGGTGVPDPYGRPFAAHEAAVARLAEAAERWAEKLGKDAP